MTIAITNREFQQLVLDTTPECSTMNAAYWFADPDDPEELGRSEQAIAIGVCGRCPIKNECFANAINNEEAFGIWGKSVPQQRHAYWRKVEDSARQATA